MLGSIPSPSTNGIYVGPFELRVYGLAIAAGVLAAYEITRRRWVRSGGDPDAIMRIAVWAVPAGLIGARLYHVVTDNQLYRGHWLDALEIWRGGLGIWGGVAAGAMTGAWVARRHGYDIPLLLDCVAPALPVAQAIGRLGNYANQELFGGPTSLPWGLRIDLAHRPVGYENVATFHPTFLYEALWNLALATFLVWGAPRLFRHLKKGRLFVVYVAGYTAGRVIIESIRVDPANHVGGQRINVWVSAGVLALALIFRAVDHPNTDGATAEDRDNEVMDYW